MQFLLNPITENTCAARNISDLTGFVGTQLRDHLVVRRAIDVLLQERQVVGRG
jgi:hypothetical protein